MVRWVNHLQNNIFVNPPPLPLSYEISGVLHLAQPSLIADKQAGRQAGRLAGWLAGRPTDRPIPTIKYVLPYLVIFYSMFLQV